MKYYFNFADKYLPNISTRYFGLYSFYREGIFIDLGDKSNSEYIGYDKKLNIETKINGLIVEQLIMQKLLIEFI